MEALLRATFTHRTTSFWAWLLLLLAALAAIGSSLPRLIGHPAEQAQQAMLQGQRLLISVNDGKITGHLAPAVTATETLERGDTALSPEAVPPYAPDPSPAEKTPDPSPATVPTAKDPRPPAARIPPRAHPEVQSTELPEPPATNPEPKTEPAPAAPASPVAPTPVTPAPVVPPPVVPTPVAPTPAEPAHLTPTESGHAPAAGVEPGGTTPAMATRGVKRPLPQAPLPALIEETREGALPRLGADGTAPMRAYAKAAADVPDGAPRIALVLLQVGLNPALIDPAMALPEDVSLSISPYAEKAASWLTMARVWGHESLLDLPLEPKDFPISDAGPRALSPREKPEENLSRLHWILSRAQGFVGLVATPDEHFIGAASQAQPVLNELGKRGLLLLSGNSRAAVTLSQTQTQSHLSYLSNTLFLDAGGGEEAFAAQWQDLANAARKSGAVVGVLRPTPLALRLLGPWMDEAAKNGLHFVPVSALVPPAPASGIDHAAPPAADAHLTGTAPAKKE